MDIKFGFSDTARELAFKAQGSQDELRAAVNSALENNSVLELEDEKGRKYIVRTERVVYVEIGSAAARPVGFAGA